MAISIKFVNAKGTYQFDDSVNYNPESWEENLSFDIQEQKIPRKDGMVVSNTSLQAKTIPIRGNFVGATADAVRTKLDTLKNIVMGGSGSLYLFDDRYYKDVYVRSFGYSYPSGVAMLRSDWTLDFLCPEPYLQGTKITQTFDFTWYMPIYDVNETTVNDEHAIGASTDVKFVGSIFTPRAIELTYIEVFPASNIGTPTDGVKIGLQSGSTISSSWLGSTLVGSSTWDAAINGTLRVNVFQIRNISTNSNYMVVMEREGAVDSANYRRIRHYSGNIQSSVRTNIKEEKHKMVYSDGTTQTKAVGAQLGYNTLCQAYYSPLLSSAGNASTPFFLRIFNSGTGGTCQFVNSLQLTDTNWWKWNQTVNVVLSFNNLNNKIEVKHRDSEDYSSTTKAINFFSGNSFNLISGGRIYVINYGISPKGTLEYYDRWY